MRLARLAILTLTTVVLATSCTFYQPIQLVPSTAPVVAGDVYGESMVEGRSCQWFVVPFFVFGDNSIATAKDAALAQGAAEGLIDVSVETQVTTYLVAWRRCTVVRGRLVNPQVQPGASESGDAEDTVVTPAAADASESTPAASAPAPPAAAPTEVTSPPTEVTVTSALMTSGNRRLIGLCNHNFGGDQPRVALDVKVAPTGQIAAIAAEGRPARFVSCVEQSLRGVAFPAFAGDPVTVHVELPLGPGAAE